jgi:hypothetical protein
MSLGPAPGPKASKPAMMAWDSRTRDLRSVKEGVGGGRRGRRGREQGTLFESSILPFSGTGALDPLSVVSKKEIIGGCDSNWGSGVGIARQWLEDGGVSTSAYVNLDQKIWPSCKHKSFHSEYSVFWFRMSAEWKRECERRVVNVLPRQD